MQLISINEREYSFEDGEIIEFAEGLIGLPEMRRAVLIEMDEYQPFCWLASLENENTRFIVVDPQKIFEGYNPLEDLSPTEDRMLSIVKISSDWEKTTINLRAPILINAEKKSGSQLILSNSDYQFSERLPQN
ncbi:MAG: flagellar assembly protein FliW [Pyrinomonadaceae bacterium]